ncbi:hypothetical protein [Oceanobacter kriegii]|uniref:hypothetical protein n=1 Tax=Oceanobacter kriegii TaxID=64972 RepID=UPI00042925CA|nr:hypothetical protein [Oceanobacter kriegii]
MMRRILLLGLGLMCGVLTGCSSPSEPHGWFPLQPGYHWSYQVTERVSEAVEERFGDAEAVTATHIRRFDVETRAVASTDYFNDLLEGDSAPVFARYTSDGTRYFYSVTDEGVMQLGVQNLIEYRPRLRTEPLLTIPALDVLQHGISWNMPTRPYLLHSTQSHVAWNRASNGFELTFELVEEGITLATPAGRFDNCILLEGRALIGLYADPRLGYQEVEVTQKEWYAPGVGLVRLERNEPMDLAMFKGGSVQFELVSFRSP